MSTLISGSVRYACIGVTCLEIFLPPTHLHLKLAQRINPDPVQTCLSIEHTTVRNRGGAALLETHLQILRPFCSHIGLRKSAITRSDFVRLGVVVKMVYLMDVLIQ